jgi:hypothetical protein
LTGTQIGLLTGITPLVTFFSAPFWTGLADAKRQHRLIMSFSILIAAMALFFLSLAQNVRIHCVAYLFT